MARHFVLQCENISHHGVYTAVVEIAGTNRYVDGRTGSYLQGWQTPTGNWCWYAEVRDDSSGPAFAVLTDAVGETEEASPVGAVLTAHGGRYHQKGPPQSTITVLGHSGGTQGKA
jgi:hypothetical protein